MVQSGQLGLELAMNQWQNYLLSTNYMAATNQS